MPKVYPKRRSLRAQAFEEENYPETSATRCIEIIIPDDDTFVQQLAGMVALATKQFNYQNTNETHAAIIAQQWRDAYKLTDWEGCMDCDDVADCIENSENVQNQINNVIAQYNKDHGIPGQLMPDGDRAANWGGSFNGSCDLDIVWAESVAVVERCNTAITDLLESLAEADTIAKGVGVLANIPVIENLGIETLTDLASLVTQIGLTSYTDAYTTEWAEELECAIFCAAQDDCIINFDKVFAILRPRVEDEIVGFVPPGNILNMTGWATQIATFVVQLLELNKADLLFYLIFGGLAYGNVIINDDGIGAGILKIAVILASDEPSNDWITLCDTCPAYEDIVFDPNPPTNPNLSLDADGGTFTGGDNRIITSPRQATMTFDPNRRVTSILVVMAFGAETGSIATLNGVDYDFVRGAHIGGETYNYVATIPDILTDTILCTFADNIPLAGDFVVVSNFTVTVWEL